jgi:uncharacterized protein
MKLLVWLTVVALIVPFAFAQSGSIRLLAMADMGDSTGGAVADLDLRVEPGKNRVYLETFPLTKITTQISMRFAQQVACRELDIDCSDKDFYFTIKALPGIVGGPSAGSAAAVLASSLIAGVELRDDTAITGTINSGGIIGPVGGLKEKITAASQSGIVKVLIPKGTSNLTDNTTNTTTDLVRYGGLIGIEVIEVSTLLDALEHFTGKNFTKAQPELKIEPAYHATMRQISIDLCNRTQKIKSSLENNRAGKNTTDIELAALNMSLRAKDVFNSSQYYASASFCFRSNVEYKQSWALQKNWTKDEMSRALRSLKERLANYSEEIDAKNITTITALQTYMAVKERLVESEEALAGISPGKESDDNPLSLAYAEERLFSAKTWARFFSANDPVSIVDQSSLKDSCISKISEADERISYVRSLLPDTLSESREELEKAYKDLSSGNYTLCLYKASKAKAEADVILGVVGVESSRIDELIDLKLSIVRNAIIRSQQKGIFPIIGYSYYEYAGSLKPIDKYSSLLFAEYALEFSNLDIYFPKEKSGFSIWQHIKPHMLWILGGIIAGIIISMLAESLQEALEQMRKKRK